MTAAASRSELESELARLQGRRSELERTACVDSRQTGELLRVTRDISMIERHLRARLTSGENSE